MKRVRLVVGAAIVFAGLIVVSFALARRDRDYTSDRIAATGQIAAFQRPTREADRIPDAVRRQRGGPPLAYGASRLVLAHPGTTKGQEVADSTDRVYVVPSEDNRWLCQIVAYANGASAAGCSTLSNFLGSPGFNVIFGWDILDAEGRPGPTTHMDITGVAASEIAKVVVRTPLSEFTAEPNLDGGFWVTLGPSALAAGTPTELVSYDHNGAQIGSLTVPSRR